MNNILLTVAYVAIAVSLVVCTVAVMAIVHFKQLKAAMIDTVNEHLDSARIARLHLEREVEVNNLLSDLILSLAHAEDPNCLRWKLHCIRRVEDMLKTSAYYDDSIYNWFVASLQCDNVDDSVRMLSVLRSFIKDLFMLDFNQRKDLDETIDIIVKLQSDIDRAETAHDELFGKLKETVRRLNFNLPLVDTVPPIQSHDVHTEGVEALFKIMEDMNTEEIVESVEKERKDEINEAAEVPEPQGAASEEPEGSEDPGEDNGEAVPEPDDEHEEACDPEGRSDVIFSEATSTT